MAYTNEKVKVKL